MRAVLNAKYLKHNFAQYRVNYADIDEPQTPWRNVHGPKQMSHDGRSSW